MFFSAIRKYPKAIIRIKEFPGFTQGFSAAAAKIAHKFDSIYFRHAWGFEIILEMVE